MLNFKHETDLKMMEDTKEIFEDLSYDVKHLKKESEVLDKELGMVVQEDKKSKKDDQWWGLKHDVAKVKEQLNETVKAVGAIKSISLVKLKCNENACAQHG